MAAIEVLQTLEYKGGQLNAALDFQDSPDDEEDTRTSHEYLNDLEEEYQARALLAKSKRFFKKGTQSSPKQKPELRPTKDFEAKFYNVNSKLELLSSSATAYKAQTSTHTTTDHYDIEWFKRGEALHAKRVEALKSARYESLNDNRSKTPTKRCSRNMTSVKSYLHKHVEQPGPKVVFGDNSTCTTEGYGSIKCNGIVFTKVAFVDGLKYNLISTSQLCDAKYIVQFDKKRGTIFNSNKEVVIIAPRVRDVYVLDMTSFSQESCFFLKSLKILTGFGIKDLLI
ncbi:hypothetical protein Tco_1459174 [Tanacetum coccineum]